MRKDRNVGIDLLRIISMCMIIIIHMNGYGGASEKIGAYSLKYFIAQALNFSVICSVNCYALISGFVNCQNIKKNVAGSVISLWKQVFFYSVGIVLLTKILKPDEIGIHQILEAFFPAMSMQYWYFTYYIPVLILMPYLNMLIEKMDMNSMRKLMASLFLIFSVFPWTFQTDWFGLNRGFSCFWLIICYLWGAWIRKEQEMGDILFSKCQKRVLVWGFIIIVAVQVLVRYGLDMLGIILKKEMPLMHDFVGYTSPFAVIEACLLVLLFSRMNICSTKMKDFIVKVSSASFGVYLIHDNHYVRKYLMMNKFIMVGQLNVICYVFVIVVLTVGIYMYCAVVELIRQYFSRFYFTKKKCGYR